MSWLNPIGKKKWTTENMDEFQNLAKEFSLLPTKEIFITKLATLPTYQNKELDDWIKKSRLFRKNIMKERVVIDDPLGSGFVFYHMPNNELKVKVKNIYKINYLIESDEYEIQEISLICKHTMLNNSGMTIFINETYKVNSKQEVYKTYTLENTENWNKDQLANVNEYIQDELKIEIGIPTKLYGIRKVPVVLFKNEYDNDIIENRVRSILNEIAKTFEAMDENNKAAGPYFLIKGKSSDNTNNDDGLINKINEIDHSRRSRFAIVSEKNLPASNNVSELVANLSTNPQFTEYTQKLTWLNDMLKQAVLTPTSTNGGKGTANQHTAEIGANNLNTDDKLKQLKCLRECEWLDFGNMYFLIQGRTPPPELKATLDIQTANDMIMQEKREQDNKFGDEKQEFSENRSK